jgi:acyl-homoserine lactone acylase PvdQ
LTDSVWYGQTAGRYLSSWQADSRASLTSLPKEKREALLSNITTPMCWLLDQIERKQAGTARTDCRKSIQNSAELANKSKASGNEMLVWALDFETFQASNNWVFRQQKTVPGKPLLANDPRLAAARFGIKQN